MTTYEALKLCAKMAYFDENDVAGTLSALAAQNKDAEIRALSLIKSTNFRKGFISFMKNGDFKANLAIAFNAMTPIISAKEIQAPFGADLNAMSDEQARECANALLQAMKIIAEGGVSE